MRGKLGMELSVNFIVMLILAITLFGFGIYFASRLFGTGGDITQQAFDKFDTQIEGLACATAEKVCVPVSTKTIGRNGIAVTGVVVQNVLGEPREFEIYAEPSIYVDKGGNEKPFDRNKMLVMPGAAPDKRRRITIDNREKKSIGVAVQPLAVESGTYSLNVHVLYSGSSGFVEYDKPAKIYVVVP